MQPSLLNKLQTLFSHFKNFELDINLDHGSEQLPFKHILHSSRGSNETTNEYINKPNAVHDNYTIYKKPITETVIGMFVKVTKPTYLKLEELFFYTKVGQDIYEIKTSSGCKEDNELLLNIFDLIKERSKSFLLLNAKIMIPIFVSFRDKRALSCDTFP
ncbi:hypothetical protein CDIK_4299, partial [Cucumispora dikerogammari]